MALFDDTVGQELAVSVLRRALAGDAQHAYLFTGPRGVGKGRVALEFAAGLICPQGGCGQCEACGRVREGIHPDVEVVRPEGTWILIDQIREINVQLVRRPFEGRARVFVLLQAETMNEPAGNALLQALEEPPPHVYFILVTEAAEKLLPTIVSRCQQVSFSGTPVGPLAHYLQQSFGVGEVEAQAFARASQGNLRYAALLASDESVREQRKTQVEWARRIPQGNLLDVELMLDEMMKAVEALADARGTRIEEEAKERLEWEGDDRSRRGLEKIYEKRAKRERRWGMSEGVEEIGSTCASWYRDLAVLAMGAEDAVFNHDYLYELQREALPGGVAGYLGAVDAVRAARERFRYNVDTRNVLQDMIFSMREALL